MYWVELAAGLVQWLMIIPDFTKYFTRANNFPWGSDHKHPTKKKKKKNIWLQTESKIKTIQISNYMNTQSRLKHLLEHLKPNQSALKWSECAHFHLWQATLKPDILTALDPPRDKKNITRQTERENKRGTNVSKWHTLGTKHLVTAEGQHTVIRMPD